MSKLHELQVKRQEARCIGNWYCCVKSAPNHRKKNDFPSKLVVVVPRLSKVDLAYLYKNSKNTKIVKIQKKFCFVELCYFRMTMAKQCKIHVIALLFHKSWMSWPEQGLTLVGMMGQASYFTLECVIHQYSSQVKICLWKKYYVTSQLQDDIDILKLSLKFTGCLLQWLLHSSSQANFL